jgi:siroheme synthase
MLEPLCCISGPIMGLSSNAVPATEKWEATMNQKDKPIVFISKEEREEVWDEAYAKEEGLIIEFDPVTNIVVMRIMIYMAGSKKGSDHAVNVQATMRITRVQTCNRRYKLNE